MWNKNALWHKHTEESKKRMSEIKKWKKCSEEAKEKMRKAKIWYVPRNKWIPMSEKTKKKLSTLHKWKPALRNKWIVRSEEWKAKQRISQTWKKHSEEHIRKQSESMKWKKHSQDTKNKLRETKLLEKNPRRQWWLSFQTYTTDRTRTLRRSIRERDHYTCKLCWELQSDTAHAVHHIDYEKKNCNPKNLITLCRNCHAKTNFNREYRKIYFLK
jgi:5-methylcytosine-specific restriction endonuclease McrA